MWVARDKDNSVNLYTTKPERSGNQWVVTDDYQPVYIELPKDSFPNLKWEDEPIEVSLEEIPDKSNPTIFESYGNHLRNLLGPYQTLVDLVSAVKDKKLTIDQFLEFENVKDLQHNINAIIEFSKKDKIENINWREDE